ncbi:DUF481 domain-containing protein [Fulvivirga lutea]|uniref:DUF481 domain-containing protein n=1 Tax=Fulvivirga lutea TaxID=2810512 RepID=A0A975A1K9_9BACT|nr:DUF481 domain-containing protein [Fulvivirga lutea]QSE97632.1 DUF481 domain-containing protein [Fulvivirga lutea]
MKILLTAALLFFTLTTYSQILKVDKGELDADSAEYFIGNINIDFNMNNRSSSADQDITFTGLNGKADLVYMSDKHAYILINNINYFKSTGGPLISTGYAHFRVNWLRKKTFSYESFSQIQYDDGRKMPMRRLLGSGVRWQVMNTDNSQIHLGTGVMFEYEEWISSELERTLVREIWKNSSYIGFDANINETVTFNGIAYFQGGMDTKSNIFRSRFSGDFSLSFTLTNNLSFSTSFSAQYEDRPIIKINNWVYSLTNGIKWEF